MTKFSVILSTYAQDNPIHLGEAINSVISQSNKPDEVVIIKDGPLKSTSEKIIECYQKKHSEILRVVRLTRNRGRAIARAKGVEASSHDLIAVMDADDISKPHRFDKQLEVFQSDPSVDVVGGYISEFATDPSQMLNVRTVPLENPEIKSYAKQRSPVNHVSVMFKKKSVIEVGNYREFEPFEDYELMVRMILNNAKIINLPEILVNVRAGQDMYYRRGGVDYALEEFVFQKHLVDIGFISIPSAIFNLCTRVPIRLLPNEYRKTLYELFLREHNQDNQ